MRIHEIHSMREVLPFLDEGAHLFFDLDYTILRPILEFGSDGWESYLNRQMLQYGVPEKEAIQRSCELWKAVQTVSPIDWVEKETAPLLRQLKERGVPLFAITARSYDMKPVTKCQLEFLGIEFQAEHPYQREGVFSDGIFHCGDLPKGSVLKEFVEKHPCKKIVFVDDTVFHLEDAAKTLTVPFVGLRYGHLDGHRAQYVPDEGTQLLGKILGNPRALQFLKKGLAL